MEKDDFSRAAEHVRGLRGLDDKTMLKLYSLYKQATVGPCNISKPGFWDMVGKSKWEAWKHLGDMDENHAKTEYINCVKEVDPQWDTKQNTVTKKRKADKSRILSGMSVSVSTMSYEDEPYVSDENKTIFDWCKEGNLEEVTRMIEMCHEIINMKDENGMTALHWSCDRGNIEIVKVLLKSKANINEQDNELQTPLHYATVCEHVNVVKHLLSEGVDVTLKDDMGTTALDVAPSEEIKNLLKDSIANCTAH